MVMVMVWNWPTGNWELGLPKFPTHSSRLPVGSGNPNHHRSRRIDNLLNAQDCGNTQLALGSMLKSADVQTCRPSARGRVHAAFGSLTACHNGQWHNSIRALAPGTWRAARLQNVHVDADSEASSADVFRHAGTVHSAHSHRIDTGTLCFTGQYGNTFSRVQTAFQLCGGCADC